ncbi:MAG: transglycosylase domain-containing protein, partial [Bacteroidales bacterium]|nr:transglycosylase domain-containing protein [Bacteroidales bacterium]
MTKRRFRKYVLGFWGIIVALFLGVTLFFAGISWGWFGDMPTFEELENPKSNLASEIYSADQVLLGKYYVENRSNTHYSKLSPHLINALLATEDIRFRNHAGIDLKSLFRVAYGVLTGTHKGGGSTITQQLAKNLFPRDSYLSTSELVMRKFKEWITAIKLERNYAKNEIIAMYFNTVSFGSNSFGIKSASRTFFNKSPMELKIE